MLPTINLALAGAPEAAVTEGGASATLALNGDNAGSFADLLRVPVPVEPSQNPGNLLPLAGELLPVGSDADSLPTDDLPLQPTAAGSLGRGDLGGRRDVR